MASEVPMVDQSVSHTVESENDKYCQTGIDAETFSHMAVTLESLKLLEEKQNSFNLSFESLRGDNDKTECYTGVDSFDKLEILIEHTKNYVPVNSNITLPVEEQIVLTLTKLRLNLDFVDLAYRFDICPTTASTCFKTIIQVFEARFKSFLIWPSREVSLKTMPPCFTDAFGNKVPVIIDCIELLIEKPSNLLAAAQCWSHSKHRHTVKLLIGMTPQGTVCYISEAWGGRASDEHIIMNSKLLDKISPGDLVLADSGFLMNAYAGPLKADGKLQIFTKGKNQLHPEEVIETATIFRVKSHMERVLGTIRQNYEILTSNTPITLPSGDDGEPFWEKIVTVCCALVNIGPMIEY